MQRSKYTDEQIAFALKQAEVGTPVEEVCRKMGISDATFCNWRKKYGGLGPSEVRREGWRDNCKRVCRLYRAGGLSLRHCRPRRNKSARLRQPKQWVGAVNEIWSKDFVADALFDGRRLRVLTVVDNYTRECLAIDVGLSLKGEDLVDALGRIVAVRGRPRTIKTDNGSEFISKAMDRRACEHGVELDFSRPGKPTDNAKVESFNGRFRAECLNAHWFLSLADAQRRITAWR